MKAFILVGGLGTRLRSMGITRPKPMVEIGGHPFLEYLVRYLAGQEILDLVFCVGYGAEEIRTWFGEGGRWGVRLEYSVETTPLGTGGAFKHAESLAAAENLVLNGDSFLELDLRRFIAFHRRKNALASVAAITVPASQDYGTIQTGRAGRIRSFSEKIPGGKGLINGGIYLLQREVLGYIPQEHPVSIEKETFPLLVATERCYAFKANGYFLDIGTPERLEIARRELPALFKLKESL